MSDVRQTQTNIEEALNKAPTAIKVVGPILSETLLTKGAVLIPSDSTPTGTYEIPYEIVTTLYSITNVTITGVPEDYTIVYIKETVNNVIKVEYISKTDETISSIKQQNL